MLDPSIPRSLVINDVDWFGGFDKVVQKKYFFGNPCTKFYSLTITFDFCTLQEEGKMQEEAKIPQNHKRKPVVQYYQQQ
jgi:hypothetical protein